VLCAVSLSCGGRNNHGRFLQAFGNKCSLLSKHTKKIAEKISPTEKNETSERTVV
jgi:hypothetical protein